MTRTLQFDRLVRPRYGQSIRLSPLIRRVTANNPGPFTFMGTGTYIIGRGDVAILDPGPADKDHIAALLSATKKERITHILVTHTHRDHSPAARILQQHCNAPVYGYGSHNSGRNAEPDDTIQVEEGADTAFMPDVELRDKDHISGAGWDLQTIWTPGHTSNHLCFALNSESALFSGDHIMGWSTTVISPPDGHMGSYLRSLQRLLKRDDAVIYPTHGPCIHHPHHFIKALIAHRKNRETAIKHCLSSGIKTIPEIVAHLYADTPKALHPAAARSVLAHLIHLHEQGLVEADATPSVTAKFQLCLRE